MYPIALGLIMQSSNLWSEVTAILRDVTCRIVTDIHTVRDPATAIEHVAKSKPDLLFVEVGSHSTQPDELIVRLKKLDPAPLIVALHTAPTVEIVIGALRAGANEFLQPPVAENLRDLIGRAQRWIAERARGKAIGFVSAKGGCGSTTIACHSAVEIANRTAGLKKRALLVDLDLNTGLSRFILKTDGAYSVLDATRNLAKLDLDYWNALVCRSRAGLDVLGSAEDASSADFDRRQLPLVVSFARHHYDWTILDLGRGFGQLAASVVPELSELYVVATPEIPSLYMAKKVLRSLDQAGCRNDKIRLILNRATRTLRSEVPDIEAALGQPVFLVLPNDYNSLRESYSSGELLPRRSALAGAIADLTDRMMGTESTTRGSGLRAIWDRARHGLRTAPVVGEDAEDKGVRRLALALSREADVTVRGE